MIQLQPNKTYRIRYQKGRVHAKGDSIYFQTLDKVPEAKHLIKVKHCETEEIVDLIELLSHPWDSLEQYLGKVPSPAKKGNDNPLKSILPLIISAFHAESATVISCPI
jgi:hypothetical protein